MYSNSISHCFLFVCKPAIVEIVLGHDARTISIEFDTMSTTQRNIWKRRCNCRARFRTWNPFSQQTLAQSWESDAPFSKGDKRCEQFITSKCKLFWIWSNTMLLTQNMILKREQRRAWMFVGEKKRARFRSRETWHESNSNTHQTIMTTPNNMMHAHIVESFVKTRCEVS